MKPIPVPCWTLRPAAVLALSLLAGACGQDAPLAATPSSTASVGTNVGAGPAAATSASPAARWAGERTPAFERMHRWSDRVIQGSQPQGEASFRELAALGVKTVISVDGAVPDVDGAAKLGLQYVHVPIGYDGISPDEQARIVKAAQRSSGPVFIHCHHGLHRGPAAAAIARIVVDGVNRDEAYTGLEESGCSPAYDGLFEVVKTFVPPTPEQLEAVGPLASAVRPQGIQEAMVQVDESWDYFKALKAASWSPPADAPDKSPAHELTILRELFAEMDRLDAAQAQGEDFLAHSRSAQAHIAALEAAWQAGDDAARAQAFDGLKSDCTACHATYRD